MMYSHTNHAVCQIAVAAPDSAAGADGQFLKKQWLEEVRRSNQLASRQVSHLRLVIDELDASWSRYLAQMADRKLAGAISTFMLAARAIAPLPVPSAMPFEGQGVHLAWDKNEHHLDVDLFRDGSFEWFYRNRLTNELDGTDQERVAKIPQALTDRIKRVSC